MTSLLQGLAAQTRRAWFISLIVGAVVLVPVDGLAQITEPEIKAITELPCPFDVYQKLAQVLQPGDALGSLGSQQEIDALAACLNSLPGDNRLVDLVKAIEDVFELVDNPPAEVTPQLVDWLEKQLDTIKSFSADLVGGSCQDTLEQIEELNRILPDAGRSYLSPARALGRGQAAVAVTSASVAFDTLDGNDVARENRVETQLNWLSVAVGVGRKVEVGLTVPVYELDLPESSDPAVPGGERAGVGDVSLGALWQFKGFARSKKRDFRNQGVYRSVLALHGGLTAPTGDQNRALGTDDWSWRVGVRADAILRANDWFRFVPYGDVWGGGRAGELGWGAALGADWPLIKEFGTFATLMSQNEKISGQSLTYADGRIGFRFRAGAHGKDQLRGVRLDGSLSYNRPLNDQGFRPTDWIGATLQFSWGGPKDENAIPPQ